MTEYSGSRRQEGEAGGKVSTAGRVFTLHVAVLVGSIPSVFYGCLSTARSKP